MTLTSAEALAWKKNLDLRAEAAGKVFADLVRTIGALRHPDTGCPWDLQQDHKSLRRYMLEEAYEASEAMLGTDDAHLLEELGDVLLQVVLNAQLAADRQAGDITAVVQAINSKMLRRHPHVFGDLAGKGISPAAIKSNWESIKAEEKGLPTEAKPGYFAEQKKIVPALTQAYKIGKRAHSIDFDWDSPGEVWAQVKSELLEFEAEFAAGDKDRLQDELGDVLFGLVQLSRHLGLDPEVTAQQGNLKFLRRFAKMEDLANARGLDVRNLPREHLERLWQEAKQLERA